MPHDPPSSVSPRCVQGPGVTSRLAAAMQASGLADPVLIVADDPAVARLAPVWQAAFAEARWTHRVLVFGGTVSRREVDAITAEAGSLGAAVIVGAGTTTVLDAALAAAAAVGLPAVVCPTDPASAAPSAASAARGAEAPPAPSPCLVLIDTDVTGPRPSGAPHG
jgi:glycerol dehydrogenase-like iron-containing ADH family enzyme